jgi:hypothetical protein
VGSCKIVWLFNNLNTGYVREGGAAAGSTLLRVNRTVGAGWPASISWSRTNSSLSDDAPTWTAQSSDTAQRVPSVLTAKTTSRLGRVAL